MLRAKHALVILGAICIALPTFAELQEVNVGGEIQIRGNYWGPEWFDLQPLPGGGGAVLPLYVRDSNAALNGRAIPDAIGSTLNSYLPLFGLTGGLVGNLKFSDRRNANSVANVEQRTRINADARFSNDIRVFIELDSLDVWGEDFRSDPITGVDVRANSSDDVEIFQGYIEMNNILDRSIQLRIGRQEIQIGGGWLVSDSSSGLFFAGVSFDGIRMTYENDNFTLDAFATKLADTSPLEEDGDVDFYGVYGSYHGIEEVWLDAYWYYLRDARSREENPLLFQGIPIYTGAAGASAAHILGVELLEDVLDVDDYSTTNLHTIGVRSHGQRLLGPGTIYWEGDVAYQFGDAGAAAFTQLPIQAPIIRVAAVPFLPLIYGDDDADYGSLGANLLLEYTLDEAKTTPSFFIGLAYLGGEDDSDVTFFESINPFSTRDASVSFNRLFTEWEYSNFLDLEGGLSNVWIINGGVTLRPTEKLTLTAEVSKFTVLEEFESPILGRFATGFLGVPVVNALSFLTRTSDDDLGFEFGIEAVYDYSNDLSFAVGYGHFFSGDGIEDGNFIDLNGLGFVGGIDDDDVDYAFVSSTLKF